MKYECTNQQNNDGKQITASGNTNTSLTGLSIGSYTDYRYPSESATWEVMPYDFTLAEKGSVTVSLGFRTSAGVGAANNTLLYIDNVRLLAKDTNLPDNIETNWDETDTNVDVYTLTGIKVRTQTPAKLATEGLEKGIYILTNPKGRTTKTIR